MKNQFHCLLSLMVVLIFIETNEATAQQLYRHDDKN